MALWVSVINILLEAVQLEARVELISRPSRVSIGGLESRGRG